MDIAAFAFHHLVHDDETFLDYVWVHPTLRGQGFTKHLFATFDTKLHLVVHTNNKSAMRCYFRRGFECSVNPPYPPAINEIGLSATKVDALEPPSSYKSINILSPSADRTFVNEIVRLVQHDRPQTNHEQICLMTSIFDPRCEVRVIRRT